MTESSPGLEAETKALKETYDALNRNDIPGFLQIFDPQIERIEPGDFPGAAVYHGIDSFKALVTLHRGKWAEGSCEIEQFLVAGDRVVVFVHVRVRLMDETEWRDGRIADVFTFRNGRAILFRTFIDRQHALEWAGINAPDAT